MTQAVLNDGGESLHAEALRGRRREQDVKNRPKKREKEESDTYRVNECMSEERNTEICCSSVLKGRVPSVKQN